MAQTITFSVSEANAQASEIWKQWGKELNPQKRSGKLCEILIKAHEEERKLKGAPDVAAAATTDSIIQQINYQNNIANPVDDLPMDKLDEIELTEPQLNPLNDEQAIQLINRMDAGKQRYEENRKFALHFFGITYTYDKRLKQQVPTIQNTEYERKRKAAEAEAVEKARKEALARQREEQEERERLFTIEKEADSEKSLEKLADDIARQIELSYTKGDRKHIPLVARKLAMSQSEIIDLSSEVFYKIKAKVIEKLKTSGGYATQQQIIDYERMLRAREAEERMRRAEENRLYEIRQAELQKLAQERARRQKIDNELREIEEEAEYTTNAMLHEYPDTDFFMSMNDDYPGLTKEEIERIKAITDPEQQKTEAIKYFTPIVRKRREHDNPELKEVYNMIRQQEEAEKEEKWNTVAAANAANSY